MLDTTFNFKDKRAKTLGIELQAPVKIAAAVPRVTTVSIPGRNGDLHYYDGSYNNRKITASCFILTHTLIKRIGEINAWLLGDGGYHRFSIDEDPQHFMLARATKGAELQPRARVLNTFSLEFDAKPQRFLTYGDKETDILSTSSTLFNPTAFAASPIIILERDGTSGTTTLNIGGMSLKTGYYKNYFVYDCELETAYGGTSLDSLSGSSSGASAGGAIQLSPGDNTITISSLSGLVSAKIIPRWWEL